MHHQIIRGVERLALPFVCEHCDRSVVLVPDHPARTVFTRKLATLPIKGISIAVIGRIAKHTHMTIVCKPAMLDVVGNVAPDKKLPHTVPCWSFRPQHPGVQTLNGGVAEFVFCEPIIENNDVLIRIANRRGVLTIVSCLTRRCRSKSCGYRAT